MSKWIDSKINEFLHTDFAVRETETLTSGSIVATLVIFTFIMYTTIFPNI